MSETTLQNVEEGKQRVTMGVLVEICNAMEIKVSDVMTRAGLIERSMSPEEWLQGFPISEQSRRFILGNLELAMKLYEQEMLEEEFSRAQFDGESNPADRPETVNFEGTL